MTNVTDLSSRIRQVQEWLATTNPLNIFGLILIIAIPLGYFHSHGAGHVLSIIAVASVSLLVGYAVCEYGISNKKAALHRILACCGALTLVAFVANWLQHRGGLRCGLMACGLALFCGFITIDIGMDGDNTPAQMYLAQSHHFKKGSPPPRSADPE